MSDLLNGNTNTLWIEFFFGFHLVNEVVDGSERSLRLKISNWENAHDLRPFYLFCQLPLFVSIYLELLGCCVSWGFGGVGWLVLGVCSCASPTSDRSLVFLLSARIYASRIRAVLTWTRAIGWDLRPTIPMQIKLKFADSMILSWIPRSIQCPVWGFLRRFNYYRSPYLLLFMSGDAIERTIFERVESPFWMLTLTQRSIVMQSAIFLRFQTCGQWNW